jgi:hypothetical protein
MKEWIKKVMYRIFFRRYVRQAQVEYAMNLWERFRG